MLDQAYIDELKTKDKKTAKTDLIEYAQSTYGIELKKVRSSFDVLVDELQNKLQKIADEPMPEDNAGLSISDLIEADDALEGKSDFPEEAKPEALAILKGEEITFAPESTVEHIEIGVVEPTVETKPLEIAHEPVVEEIGGYVLPISFAPTTVLIGPAPGYANVPYWVYDFIEQDENWKENIENFKHKNDVKILQSLLYYIKKYGSVKIRESRNSRFHVLN